MVHALKQAWRVLVPNGVMIDVRPLSVDMPVEVVYPGGSDLAGRADPSPDLKYDIAADKAVFSVLKDGLFQLTDLDLFEFVYYWKTYHGMVVDFAERWQDELIVPQQVLKRAQRLYREHRHVSHLRMPMKMQLGKYIKLG